MAGMHVMYVHTAQRELRGQGVSRHVETEPAGWCAQMPLLLFLFLPLFWELEIISK